MCPAGSDTNKNARAAEKQPVALPVANRVPRAHVTLNVGSGDEIARIANEPVRSERFYAVFMPSISMDIKNENSFKS